MYIHTYDNENGAQQVQSGSDILLGSTGSFKRFESVDRSTYEGELVSAMPTPPWTTDESIPPQPLRPAPLPLATKLKSRNSSSSSASSASTINKHEGFEQKSSITSAPAIKSIPRPIPRKQMSAPAASSQIPLINPPTNNEQSGGLNKFVKDMQSTTNPFLNGLINFESIKSNFFSTTIMQDTPSECKIENERATKSAIISKNPFKNSSSSSISSGDNNIFDFNPNTIKSIMEEAVDDGYDADADNDDCDDPLKQLEVRIQKLEASNKQRRRSDSQSPPRFSPKSLNKSSSETPTHSPELNSNVNEKFVESLFSDDRGFHRKHMRNRSYSENEVISELGMLCEQGDFKEPQHSPVSTTETTSTVSTSTASGANNPFNSTATTVTATTNSKRPLLKTPSETYLEQYSTMMKSNVVTSGPNVILNNNKSIQLCKHPSLNKILQSSSTSLFDGNDAQQNLTSTSLKRTISSESISSDSSVIMSTLERPVPPITGNLCIALQYDK